MSPRFSHAGRRAPRSFCARACRWTFASFCRRATGRRSSISPDRRRTTSRCAASPSSTAGSSTNMACSTARGGSPAGPRRRFTRSWASSSCRPSCARIAARSRLAAKGKLPASGHAGGHPRRPARPYDMERRRRLRSPKWRRRPKRAAMNISAITDHSRHVTRRPWPRSGAAVAADRRDRPRRRGLHGLTLLKGCEVDILADGRLDLPDDILSRLDRGRRRGPLQVRLAARRADRANHPRDGQSSRIDHRPSDRSSDRRTASRTTSTSKS